MLHATWAPLVEEGFTAQEHGVPQESNAFQALYDMASGLSPNQVTFLLGLAALAGAASDTSHISETMHTALSAMLKDYLHVAHRRMDGEEISDLNTYVASIQDAEERRLAGMRRAFVGSLNVSKQMYLMHTAWAHMTGAVVRLCVYGILAIALVAAMAPGAAQGNRVLLGLIAAVLLLYGGMVTTFVVMTKYRRRDDWNKVYWSVKESIDAVSNGVKRNKIDDPSCSADGLPGDGF